MCELCLGSSSSKDEEGRSFKLGQYTIYMNGRENVGKERTAAWRHRAALNPPIPAPAIMIFGCVIAGLRWTDKNTPKSRKRTGDSSRTATGPRFEENGHTIYCLNWTVAEVNLRRAWKNMILTSSSAVWGSGSDLGDGGKVWSRLFQCVTVVLGHCSAVYVVVPSY